MTEQERKTREACGRWDKGKKKKKNRSGKAGKMIGWFSHQSLKTEKHSDMLEPRESFGSSPGLKSGTGSRQQLLHALHLTHRCQYSIHTEEENLWILQSLTQTETHYHSECTNTILRTFCTFPYFLSTMVNAHIALIKNPKNVRNSNKMSVLPGHKAQIISSWLVSVQESTTV